MVHKVSNYKYIPVKRETKDDLDRLGNKGQTYDQLVVELIKKWRESN